MNIYMKVLVVVFTLILIGCGSDEPTAKTSLVDDPRVDEPYDGDTATFVAYMTNACDENYMSFNYTEYYDIFEDFRWRYDEIIPYSTTNKYREWTRTIQIPSSAENNIFNSVMFNISSYGDCDDIIIELYFNDVLIEEHLVTFENDNMIYKLSDLREM